MPFNHILSLLNPFKLLGLDFDGVNGRVRFSPSGDREDPQYSLHNFRRVNGGDTTSWVSTGSVGSEIGSAKIDMRDICFAGVGCGLDSAPSDSYPVPEPPPDELALWIPIVIGIIAVLLVGAIFSYLRVRGKWKEQASQMTEMQKKMEAIKNIDNDLDDINQVVDKAKKRQESLIMKRAAIQGTPSTWSDSPDILVPLTPEDEEYWSVFEKMRTTIPNVHISKLWRVQNKSLWSFYSFHKVNENSHTIVNSGSPIYLTVSHITSHKDRLEEHKIPTAERRVWHGTSSLDPFIVYNDKMDGFMMQ